jgi:hypothetical protein
VLNVFDSDLFIQLICIVLPLVLGGISVFNLFESRRISVETLIQQLRSEIMIIFMEFTTTVSGGEPESFLSRGSASPDSPANVIDGAF